MPELDPMKRRLTWTVHATPLMTLTTDLGLSIRVSMFEYVRLVGGDVTFSSQNVTLQVLCDAFRFRKSFFSTSKNVTISLELCTNVTISSHRHIIFLGLAWNKAELENLARS